MGSESPPSGGNDAYCITGREVPQDKSKAMQEILTGDSVGICPLSRGPNCDFMQVPKDSEACSHHALNRISGVSSKIHLTAF